MKMIKVLLLLQTVMLVVLLYGQFGASDPGKTTQTTPLSQEHDLPLGAEADAKKPAPEFSGIDERRLRQVIRSELTTALAGLERQDGAKVPPVVEIDPFENAQRLEFVTEALSQYYSAGVISDEEMVQLQSEIAQLDPESRSLLMKELERAIFTGQIKGRL